MADEKTYADGSPILQYPKMIYLSDNTKVIVNDAKEEKALTADKPKSNEPAWKTN